MEKELHICQPAGNCLIICYNNNGFRLIYNGYYDVINKLDYSSFSALVQRSYKLYRVVKIRRNIYLGFSEFIYYSSTVELLVCM